ncbi:MAG: apolipoprotein N-acyltransferase [Melioribacteraceae bacterium]|nr:apolipoprotein N-acyltransferase [Melioribacteraceae bacterium]
MWFKSTLTFDEKKIRNKQLLLGLLSGTLLGLSFPPIPLPYLMFTALIPYFFVIEKRKTLAEVNRITFFTFFIFSIITLYWVGSWMPEADPFLMTSGVALVLFNPVLFLIPSTLFHYTRKIFTDKIAFVLFPFFWVFYEYIYGLTDLRFPWLVLGHGLAYFKSFIQIADTIGALGISLLVLFINVSLFFLLKTYFISRKIDLKIAVLTFVMILLPIIYGSIKVSSYNGSERSVKVGLIQPDLNPWNKWELGSLDDLLDIYLTLSNKAVQENAEIIIWPETALPRYIMSGSYPGVVKRIRNFVDSNNVYLMTGMPDATFYREKDKAPEDAKKAKSSDLHYTSYNSILGFTPNERKVEKYGKIKLVPFGEHAPFVEHIPFIGDFIKWNVGISSWNIGKDTLVFNYKKSGSESVKIGGVVCIESIYPDFIAQFVDRGAEMLAVATNDSWYGNSSGPYQHKEISVLRAIENRRSVVRAANGGISAIINPIGFVVSETKMYTRDFLVGDVELNNEKTFYTENPLLIQYLSSIITLLIIFLIVISQIKTKFLRKENE